MSPLDLTSETFC